jgi:perosamine synthetase
MTIQVCEPLLAGNELRYIQEAVSTGWISSTGKYVSAFEQTFAAYCGVKYGVAVCNGTVALHLALVAIGIGAGDEVILPDFTMAASAFAICYTGARPVFVDADPRTWNIDVQKIEAKIGPRTKAIMPVHIFGNPCDMDGIRAIAEKHGLLVVEDAAEAHGAEYRGRKAGALSKIAGFSFFSNKIIATGEGGMVVTDDQGLYERSLYFKNICFPLKGPRNYIHEDIGFNYRMSNLHAALGLAQTERADYYRDCRIRNNRLYTEQLAAVPGIKLQKDEPDSLHVHWMNAIVLDPIRYGRTRDETMAHLKQKGIDTRLLFVGMHGQPALIKFGCDPEGDYAVTDELSANGFYLPSGSGLTEEQIAYVCDAVREFRA